MEQVAEKGLKGPWEIVEDSQGFQNIHLPREDGHLGDIVATCYQDEAHARLIAAAPDLLDGLSGLVRATVYDAVPDAELRALLVGKPIVLDPAIVDALIKARAALAKAAGQ